MFVQRQSSLAFEILKLIALITLAGALILMLARRADGDKLRMFWTRQPAAVVVAPIGCVVPLQTPFIDEKAANA